ncbi:MAG: DUF1844 domain-containing protein [Candidatus Omnitrophica bacterium]|nr:DUF1844 domain-containing protein [Candidatus Omnitrophota bacterium]
MMEKDIRFSDKKVDQSWKESAQKERPLWKTPEPQAQAPSHASQNQVTTSKAFMNLLSSLGVQAMFHLGEIPNPETQEREVNLQAAREVINILSMLKEKSEGNRSREESEVMTQLLTELQMKFSEKV